MKSKVVSEGNVKAKEEDAKNDELQYAVVLYKEEK